jgi:asparaginyl-tRNA synthetase
MITSSDCEGAGEVFTVVTNGPETELTLAEQAKAKNSVRLDFFRKPKYLTVSTQLHLEALIHSYPRVWTLSPSFRAEKSDTPRHLSEFYMLEAEMAFTNSLEDVMSIVEGLLRNIVSNLQRSNIAKELLGAKRNGESGLHEHVEGQQLEKRWQDMLMSPWPRITYTDAVSMLQTRLGS